MDMQPMIAVSLTSAATISCIRRCCPGSPKPSLTPVSWPSPTSARILLSREGADLQVMLRRAYRNTSAPLSPTRSDTAT
jgi:hypothetical protein